MKKNVCKALLSLLCALTLLLGAVPFAAFTASAVGTNFPWTKQNTLLEEILQRDGLLDGVWFPWFNAGGSGHNLTGNDVMAKYYDAANARVEMDYYGADKIYQEIYNLKAMGFNMMAYGGSIYGEGVVYDDYGDVIGIKPDYLDNVRRLLNMCREIGMPVMWNIYFHSSSAPHYHGMQGWNIICRMLGDRTVADHYAERFVKPLCKVLGEYPDVVALISIADEPENEVNDAEIGNHFTTDRAYYGVNMDDMVYFMKGINDTVREVLPGMPRTVASNAKNKAIYSGFDLDLMGLNRYDTNANIDTTSSFFTDADIILTEYNIGGDATSISDEVFADRLIKFRENFRKEGYQGGFQWCWIPGATDAAYYMLHKGAKTHTDFKATISILRHYIDDFRAKHQGKEKPAVDTPVLYCNEGTGLVEWIPPRQTTTMTLERSDDGGKTWKTILDNVDSAKYVNDRQKGVYRDTTAPKSGFCYRITVKDSQGNTATSAPNNEAGTDKAYKQTYQAPVITYPTATDRVAPLFKKAEMHRARLQSFGVNINRPISSEANLIKNAGFESTGGQWNNSTFLKNAKVVSDKTAPEGSKSLYFDTSSVAEGTWYKFTVNVAKNTDYVLSTWIKGDYLGPDNAGRASFGVFDDELGGFMVYWDFYRDTSRGSRLDQQLYPTAWDDEWHLRSVSFNSGDQTTLTLALYGYGSKMWLDDVALYRADDGIKYVSEKAGSYLGYSYYVEHATCDPAKSVTQNVRLDDSKSTYWQSGDGWRNGFLSIADNKYEYGKSLKYKATANPVGNYYVKWVDVKPNTEYVFSASIKILKSGRARLSLIEDNVSMPREMMGLEIDSEVYGDEWFQYSITLKSNAFDKIGIGICDLGGEALFDNIRLFKVSDGKEVSDPYKDKSGSTVAPPTATVKPSVAPTDGITSATEPSDSVTTLPTDAVSDPTEPSQGEETQPTAPTDGEAADTDGKVEKKGAPWLFIGIGVAAVVLIAGGVVLFLFLRKKKQA